LRLRLRLRLRLPVILPWLVAFDFRVPSVATEPTDKTPQGRRAWTCVVFRHDRGEPEIGEALLRPGERAGAVRRLPRPQLHRSWVVSKNPGGRVDPARAARRARRQGVLSLSHVSLHEQRCVFQQPDGWSRWLAPRREAKAFDPDSALLWPLLITQSGRSEHLRQSDSQQKSVDQAIQKQSEKRKLESRAFAPASQERVTSLCSCKEK